jgi:anti-anti-sigma factor
VSRRHPPEDFAVVLSWEGDVPIVTAHGDVDGATGPELWDYIDAILATKPERIVIDLGPMTFIDSGGLNVIVKTYKRQQEDGGEVIIRSPSPTTRRVLELVGLAGLLPIEAAPS